MQVRGIQADVQGAERLIAGDGDILQPQLLDLLLQSLLQRTAAHKDKMDPRIIGQLCRSLNEMVQPLRHAEIPRIHDHKLVRQAVLLAKRIRAFQRPDPLHVGPVGYHVDPLFGQTIVQQQLTHVPAKHHHTFAAVVHVEQVAPQRPDKTALLHFAKRDTDVRVYILQVTHHANRLAIHQATGFLRQRERIRFEDQHVGPADAFEHPANRPLKTEIVRHPQQQIAFRQLQMAQTVNSHTVVDSSLLPVSRSISGDTVGLTCNHLNLKFIRQCFAQLCQQLAGSLHVGPVGPIHENNSRARRGSGVSRIHE